MNERFEDDELRDLIDSSFGSGPAPAPAADRLAPARRALRRRRILSGGGAVAGVVAAVTATALISGGSGGDARAVQPAAPAPAPSESTSTAPSAADWCMQWLEDLPTDFSVTSTMAPDDGSSGSGSSGAMSSEVHVHGDGDLESAPSLGCSFDGAIGEIPTEFGSASEPLPGESDLVRFTDDTSEALTSHHGSEILEQFADVDLPDNFAGPDDRTAVARVLDVDVVFYVLARQLEGSRPEYIETADPEGRWPTIAAFLRHAEKQYDSEEGLR